MADLNETCVKKSTPQASRRLSVAPMLDWTDRHYRYMARLITKNTWLYTEMVTTGALLHGNVERFLQYNTSEQPLALQLGGSEPEDLAKCAKLALEWGYQEVNLNVGCPSERVQNGSFGACLMLEPELVASCVRAMKEAVGEGLEITVKHRIGIDKIEDYDFLRNFVDIVADAGCKTFIVHARNAILKGLSPKENREIPPLKYDFVYRLKQERPDLEIILNGGVSTLAAIEEHLKYVDGVMVGREAYHNPWIMHEWDERFYGALPSDLVQYDVVQAMHAYTLAQIESGNKLRNIARHMLGLYQGLKGARHWRRSLSDANLLKPNDAALILQAAQYCEAVLASQMESESDEC